MSADAELKTTLARLQAAAGEPALSASARSTAHEFWSRLSTGVRVVVTGRAGSGKSTLCDVLAGTVPASASPEQGTRVFCHESVPPTSEQVTNVIPGTSEFLKNMQLTDLSAPTDPDLHRAALLEADIVIWCTAAFTADERAVWAPVPDHLKDHSFLVLPSADVLARKGQLAGRVALLQEVASEEFHSFFPVASLTVFSRLSDGHPVSEKHLSASGIGALSETIAKLVSSGRRADLDGASLFLERHSAGSGPVRSQPEPATADKNPAKAAAADVILSAARDLAALAGQAEINEYGGIMEICSSLSEELNDLACDAEPSDPDAELWWDELSTAGDKLMLVGLEDGPGPAADAATIVLQLSREVQSRAVG